MLWLRPNVKPLSFDPQALGDKRTFQQHDEFINGKLAKYINKKHHRRGSVFWDRFKSIPVRSRTYLRNLILYVHANPLKAGIVSDLDALLEYPWTSHADLLGVNREYSWLRTEYMMLELGISEYGCIGYLAGLSQYRSEEFDPWENLSDLAFTEPTPPDHASDTEREWIRAKILEIERERSFRIRLQKQPDLMPKLYSEALNHFIVQYIPRYNRSGNESKALRLFAFWAVCVAGYTGALVAKIVGLSPNTVLRAARKGKEVAEIIPFPFEIEKAAA